MTLLCEQHHIWGMQLPPSSFAEPPGVHLAHVAHANDADYEAIHPLRDGCACRSGCHGGGGGGSGRG